MLTRQPDIFSLKRTLRPPVYQRLACCILPSNSLSGIALGCHVPTCQRFRSGWRRGADVAMWQSPQARERPGQAQALFEPLRACTGSQHGLNLRSCLAANGKPP